VKRFERSDALWGICYVIVLAAVVVGLGQFRSMAVQKYSSPQHLAAWQKFRNDMAQIEQQVQSGDFHGPVARRMPKSPEPPVLVLMRDHYAVCLTGVVVLVTALFLALAMLLRGVLRKRCDESSISSSGTARK